MHKVKSNKDLTPEERVIFVREWDDGKSIKRQAMIRIGNKVYAQWIDMADSKSNEEWTDACARIILACKRSASFFEFFGMDYFDAPKVMQGKAYGLFDYPIRYIKHA